MESNYFSRPCCLWRILRLRWFPEAPKGLFRPLLVAPQVTSSGKASINDADARTPASKSFFRRKLPLHCSDKRSSIDCRHGCCYRCCAKSNRVFDRRVPSLSISPILTDRLRVHSYSLSLPSERVNQVVHRAATGSKLGTNVIDGYTPVAPSPALP